MAQQLLLALAPTFGQTTRTPGDLDFLRGEFLATGALEPVRKLRSLLDADAAGRPKPTAETPRDENAVLGDCSSAT